MKNNLNVYYDEEGDFLEIGREKSKKGYFKNLGDGVFERIEENKVVGIAIVGLKAKKHITMPFDVKIG